MKTIITILAISLLTACAQTQFTKAGATQADFQRDMAACQYETEKYSAPASDNIGVMLEASSRKTRLTQMCMSQKGYYLVRK
jgi:hypothetical protein